MTNDDPAITAILRATQVTTIATTTLPLAATFTAEAASVDDDQRSPLPTLISGTSEADDVPSRHAVETTLRSADQALEPIALEVRSVTVERERLTFQLAFINMARHGYRLSGVNGNAAVLVDENGRQYQPTTVSETLQDAIMPAGGWQPAEESLGTITFARPASLNQVRFVFPFYNALTLGFNSSGLVRTEITSSTGGAPSPVPTTKPADQAFLDLHRLLARLAQSAQAGDANAYLSAFAPALRSEQRILLERLRRVPLASYRLALDPSADLLNAGQGTLQDIPIEVRYTFNGISAANQFLSSLRFDFKRVDGEWQVTLVGPGEQPPFWHTGNIATDRSQHFLIFTRPEAAEDLSMIKQEAEAAYAQLAQRGLALDERYVAFVTATVEGFRQYAGQGDRVVGTARWRYRVSGDQFEVVNRAFYVNGTAFHDDRTGYQPGERRTTIAHELVHLALAAETRPFTPAWLAEGIAVYYADQSTTAERQGLVMSGALDQLTLEQLTQARSLVGHAEGDNPVPNAYTFAGAAVDYLAQHYSEAKMRELYRSYSATPPARIRGDLPDGASSEEQPAAGDLSVEQTNEALQRIFDLTLSGLDDQVKQWLRTQYG